MATNPTIPQPVTQPVQQPVAQQPVAQAVPVPANPNNMTAQQVQDYHVTQQPVQQPVIQQPPMQIPGLPPITREADGMLHLRLPTGQDYKGQNEQELLAAVATAQISASQHITNLNQETARLRNGLAAVTGQPQVDASGQPVQPQSQFDRAVYMELHAQDPILAMNYLDQHRFGLQSLEAVVPAYQNTFRAASEFQTAQVVNNFRILAPDFPGTQQAVDAVMNYMQQQKVPFTAQNLKLVHDGMVRLNATDPTKGYAPLQMQPAAPIAPGVSVPPAPAPQGDMTAFDPSPTGNYAFGPNGFGSNFPSAPTVVAPPAAQVQPPQAMPQAGYPVRPNVPTTAAPMPMPPITPTQAAPSGQMNETVVSAMGTDALRQFIEGNLQR